MADPRKTWQVRVVVGERNVLRFDFNESRDGYSVGKEKPEGHFT